MATFPQKNAHMHAQANHRTAVAPQCDLRWRTIIAHTTHHHCASPLQLPTYHFTTPRNHQIFVTAVVLGATSPHPSPPLHHPAAHGTTSHRCCKCRRIANKKTTNFTKVHKLSASIILPSITTIVHRTQPTSFGRFAAAPPTVCHTPRHQPI